MKVIYEKSARKGLRKMLARDRTALMTKLDTYAATGAGDVRKLTNRPEYRLRHGDWRALFVIEEDVVVVTVAHRSAVYG